MREDTLTPARRLFQYDYNPNYRIPMPGKICLVRRLSSRAGEFAVLFGDGRIEMTPEARIGQDYEDSDQARDQLSTKPK